MNWFRWLELAIYIRAEVEAVKQSVLQSKPLDSFQLSAIRFKLWGKNVYLDSRVVVE